MAPSQNNIFLGSQCFKLGLHLKYPDMEVTAQLSGCHCCSPSCLGLEDAGEELSGVIQAWGIIITPRLCAGGSREGGSHPCRLQWAQCSTNVVVLGSSWPATISSAIYVGNKSIYLLLGYEVINEF